MAKEHVAGSLAVNVLANTKNFDKKMKASGKRVKNFSDVTSMAMDKVFGGIASATGVSVAALGATTAAIAAVGAAAGAAAFTVFKLYDGMAGRRDQLTKTAQVLGLNNQQLEEWTLAAGFAGIEQAAFVRGQKTLQQRLAETKWGVGEASKAFNALGIDAARLTMADSDTQLRVVIDRLNMITNSTEKLALAQKVFGEESGFGFVRLGTEEMNRAEEFQKRMGATPDAGFENAEKFKDSLLELTTAATRLSEKMLDAFGPSLIEAMDTAVDLLARMKTLADATSSAFGGGPFAQLAGLGGNAPVTGTATAVRSGAGLLAGAAPGAIGGGNIASAIYASVTASAVSGARQTARNVLTRPIEVVQGGNR